jgi:lysophospholipase L1-like esterase
MKIKNILMLFALGLLFACEPKIDTFTTTSGEADFTKYVALGNSLTSGYADGDLYKSGQENSYPAILAGQFEAAGGGEFKQPLMFDEYGFGRRFLLDASIPAPVLAGVAPDERNFQSIAADGPFNNMGVPGAKSFHLGVEGYGALNPYFGRFASAATTSVLADALAQNPTFFTLWIGNNDVLAYALEGAAADSITPMPYFQGSIGAILGALDGIGAKGAIANIPNITSIPYFTFMNTRLPYKGLVLDATQAGQLNYAYQQFELYLASIGINYSYGFNFVEGTNAFVVEDENIPFPDALAAFRVRQMTAGELFLLTLPTDSLINHGMGSVNTSGAQPMPYGIPDKYILSTIEINEIETATTAFNTVIKNFASQFDIAFVDMNAKLAEIEQGGVVYDGVPFTTAFITGNSFSLDGVHMTAQGNALAANYFIDAINAKYNSVLKHVSPRLYPGIYYYQ